MFLLAELKDTIRIPPEMFNLKLLDAVKDEINRKLANKVNNNYYGKYEDLPGIQLFCLIKIF